MKKEYKVTRHVANTAEEEKEGDTDISIACFSFLSRHFQQDSDDI